MLKSSISWRPNGVGGVPSESSINPPAHGLFNSIDTEAKCRHQKKFTFIGAVRQVFYMPEASSPPMTPYSPLNTVYVYTVYLVTQGRGGELTREKVRGTTVQKSGRKYQYD
jgi:hypothetical protein